MMLRLGSRQVKFALISIIALAVASNFRVPEPKAEESAPLQEESLSGLLTIEENTLLPISPLPEPKVIRKVKVLVTAYSSTILETDEDPYVTAAGTQVREGIVASNLLPFGAKIRLPELYGNKIFIVEDRMNSKKGRYHIDIWFPSYWEAKNFGAKLTYIELLES